LQSSSCKIEAGWIELIVIEARDLVAADLRGTSDPYVRVQYGNKKKRTKVWWQILVSLLTMFAEMCTWWTLLVMFLCAAFV
jgi:hypothetical protein